MILVRSSPARPTKGSPLYIFVCSRGLTDEHQLCVRVTDAENDGVPERDQIGTFGAGKDLGAQLFEQLHRGRLWPSLLIGNPDRGMLLRAGSLTRVISATRGASMAFASFVASECDPLQRGKVRTEFRLVFQTAQHFDDQGQTSLVQSRFLRRHSVENRLAIRLRIPTNFLRLDGKKRDAMRATSVAHIRSLFFRTPYRQELDARSNGDGPESGGFAQCKSGIEREPIGLFPG